MAKKTMTLEHIDYSISRWKTRLKRAMTAIDKLEKQRKRILKAQADLAVAPPLAKAVERGLQAGVQPLPPAPRAPVPPKTDDDIPSFLRRSPDPVAEAIKVEQAETKRLKAQGRIAKMKAKQSGETKRMPLTGKAALAAIRGQ